MANMFGQWHIFNVFYGFFYDGTILLTAHTLKMMLLNNSYVLDSPFPAQTKYSDISGHEIAAGNGYATGGVVITGAALNVSGDLMTFECNRTTWTASGGSMAAARYAVIYDFSDAVTPKGLITGVRFDNSPITISAGNTLDIDGFGGTGGSPGIIFEVQSPGTVQEYR